MNELLAISLNLLGSIRPERLRNEQLTRDVINIKLKYVFNSSGPLFWVIRLPATIIDIDEANPIGTGIFIISMLFKLIIQVVNVATIP